MNVRRLRKWAKGLRSIRQTKTKRFDMLCWYYGLYKTNQGKITDDRFNRRITNPETPCGFAGCAVGWLPTFFPKVFTVNQVSFGAIEEAMGYFGLSPVQFGMIAYPANYGLRSKKNPITPKEVAKRIEEVIADKCIVEDSDSKVESDV